MCYLCVAMLVWPFRFYLRLPIFRILFLVCKWKFTGTQVQKIFGFLPGLNLRQNKNNGDHTTVSIVGHAFLTFEDVGSRWHLLFRLQ